VEQELARVLDMPVRRPVAFAPQLDLEAGIGPPLERMLDYLLDEASHADGIGKTSALAGRQVERALVALLLDGQPHAYSDALHGRAAGATPRHVRLAEEYIRANLAEPLSAGEIAAAAGVSVRTLDQAFARHRRYTPMQLLRALRLERVRADLERAAPGATVSSVALAWGFPHLGRFAAYYAGRFGEAPSETLRRARRRVGA
jgi:transcriptional regulator GlxA family with amidase domain